MTIDLSAATSGQYAGMMIFQDRGKGQAITVSGNAIVSITGVIYAADTQLILNGDAQLLASSLVVGTLLAEGKSQLS